MPDTPTRYHRQQILPMIGDAGMARLRGANVLLIGVGALGGTIADQLVRAGVGRLRLVDRDLVDWTNLHRQVLFSEQDARDSVPKAIAAAARLVAINSEVALEPLVLDVHSGNIEQLAGLSSVTVSGGRQSPGGTTPRPDSGPTAAGAFHADLILDGTDNAETRYLINDLAVKHGIPWVYGACVGVEGRIMPILPGHGPCLRCIFPQSPRSGELATCDTAGVLGPAAAAVAALQASLAIRILASGGISGWTQGGDPSARDRGQIHLLSLNAWTLRVHTLDVSNARQPDCPACGRHQFEFLSLPPETNAVTLCGRHAVQVRSGLTTSTLDLSEVARRLASAGQVQALPYLVRCKLTDSPQITLSVFADGRTVVDGTTDIAQARTLVARYVGA
jgi:molybdopterin-synthase adenylyltransferase